MGSQPHSGRLHSVLAPSASERWMVCTPSARMEEKLPDTSSVFADEGTLAHEYAEAYFKRYLKVLDEPGFKKEVARVKAHDLYSAEMDEYVEGYVARVLEIYHDLLARDPQAKMIIEKKVPILHVPECNGHIDVTLVAPTLLEIWIIDLKYGKGKVVKAYENTQLMIYGWGAFCWARSSDLLKGHGKITMAIDQPRLAHNPIFEMSTKDLADWATKTLKPAAQKAWEGKGEFNPGGHCQFCKVKACRARAEYMLSAVGDSPDPNLLTEEELAHLFLRADGIRKWVGVIEELCLHMAIHEGTKFPGLKLVRGRSVRQVVDETGLQKALMGDGFTKDDFTNSKLKGIGDLEKLVGPKYFKTAYEPYVLKPDGAPTLVHESDPRQEFSPIGSDFDDIELDDEDFEF